MISGNFQTSPKWQVKISNAHHNDKFTWLTCVCFRANSTKIVEELKKRKLLCYKENQYSGYFFFAWLFNQEEAYSLAQENW